MIPPISLEKGRRKEGNGGIVCFFWLFTLSHGGVRRPFKWVVAPSKENEHYFVGFIFPHRKKKRKRKKKGKNSRHLFEQIPHFFLFL